MRPVIAHRVGGMPEVGTANRAAEPMPLDEGAALASVLRRVLRNPEAARAYATPGVERATAGLGFDAQSQRLIEVYGSAVGGATRDRR